MKKDASRSQIVYTEANGVVLTSQTMTLWIRSTDRLYSGRSQKSTLHIQQTHSN